MMSHPQSVHSKALGYSTELHKWLLERLAFRDEGMSEAAVLLKISERYAEKRTVVIRTTQCKSM